MNKDREAIRELVSLIRQSPCNYIKAIDNTEQFLKAHGWIPPSEASNYVRLDMVVGKKMVCDIVEDCPPNNPDCDECEYNCRTTIADLIGEGRK